MAEEKLPYFLTRLGHVFDPAPFAVDLYRLVCFVLGDKPVAKLGPSYYHLTRLKEGYARPEVTRILIATAVARRIKFDRMNPRELKELKEDNNCGKLYPNWPMQKRKTEPLTLREACNKIVHAEEIRFDIVIPDAKHNPDEAGVYLSRPYIYLYGTKDRVPWRAVLFIIDFAEGAAAFFQRD